MKEELYSITDTQKTIWNTEIVYRENPITNIIGTCTIHEKVNFELLEKSINQVIENNDALRIKIKIINNEPMQYFEDYKPTKIETYKVQNDNELKNLINKKSKTPLSYKCGNMVKFIMFKYPNETGGTIIIINHILSDAWSTTLISSQIAQIYDKLKHNDESKNNIIKSSYIDYIEFENQYKNSEKYNRDKLFWENYLSSIPEEVASLKNKDDVDNLNTNAERKEISINKLYTKKIKEYCKENNISCYTFFLSLYSLYLSKFTSNKEIIVNTPILNRRNIKEKQTLGMFVNSLPIKIDINNNLRVNELFEKVAHNSLSIFRHQRYSIFKIFEYLKEKNNNTYLYDLVFSYQNSTSIPTENNLEYSSKWYFNGNITETLNIHISDLDSKGNFDIYYDYKVNQLTENDIIEMHSRMMKIIEQVLNNKQVLIKDINILNDKDIVELKKLNNTGNVTNDETTVNSILENICKKYSNKPAIKYKNTEITYRLFYERVNSLANLLRKKGVKRNTPVAIMLDKSIEMIISMFSVIRAGGYYIPILPDEEQKRIDYILSDSNPLCIITQENYSYKIKNFEIIDIYNDNFPYACINQINKSSDILYMIYTSGSTGNPKGTQIMHKNVCGLMKSIKTDNILKPTAEDISMLLLKNSFDASGIDIYSSLLFGGKLLIIDKENELNPQVIVKIIEKEKVTRSFLIPKWVEQIAIEDKKQNSKLNSLKILGTGGEILKPNTVEHLFKKYHNLKILNLYGPTETTMFVSYKLLGENEFKTNITSIGKPIKYSRCMVINDENSILPPKAKGELVIYEDDNSINNIAKGYLNLEEHTNKKFLKIYNPILNKYVNAYKTGDIVKINENLDIEYIGRTDDKVKINGGYLIALNEIENIIYKLINKQYKVAVVAIPHNNTKIIIAFVEGDKEELTGIEKLVNKNITFYMKPKKIIPLELFPRNNSGKIDKKKLTQIAVDIFNNTNKTVVKPKNQTEKIIYNVVNSHLKGENLSIKDDFINDLGIDSLTLATIFSELDFYNIKLQDIYTYSNIESLANFISKGNTENNDITIKNINIKNNCKKFDLSNVLITGITGFLGVHILRELLYERKVKKIYCIIRNQNFKSGNERLKEIIDFYFGKKNTEIYKLIDKKVIVVTGNITKKNLGIDNKLYKELKQTISTVINAAASVKHYGKLETLMNTNFESIKHIVEFCGRKISLAHISTLSVAGFKNEKTLNKIFDEDTFYINQSFNNNPYLISKCLAEQYLLENRFINLKIFRVGNVMPRISDGKFQINYNKNAFINAFRNFVITKKIPSELINTNIEFSPVDECAKAIVKTIKIESNQNIFHIVNSNFITIGEIIEILKKSSYDINIVSINEFMNELEKYEEIGKQYIKEYIIQNNINNYSTDKTENILKTHNFKWSVIDKKYLKKIIDLIEKNRW